MPADAWLRAIFAFTWGSAFLGAAYGPILIPIGAALLVRAGRVDGGSPRVGWAFIVAALLATAVSYVWLLDAVELP